MVNNSGDFERACGSGRECEPGFLLPISACKQCKRSPYQCRCTRPCGSCGTEGTVEHCDKCFGFFCESCLSEDLYEQRMCLNCATCNSCGEWDVTITWCILCRGAVCWGCSHLNLDERERDLVTCNKCTTCTHNCERGFYRFCISRRSCNLVMFCSKGTRKTCSDCIYATWQSTVRIRLGLHKWLSRARDRLFQPNGIGHIHAMIRLHEKNAQEQAKWKKELDKVKGNQENERRTKRGNPLKIEDEGRLEEKKRRLQVL